MLLFSVSPIQICNINDIKRCTLNLCSTGCIETSEAIMGVTKVLMASNDTLFNFEDTLGDREDLLSPRNMANAECNLTISTTSRPDSCRTPTNEGYLHVYASDYKPNDSIVYSETKRFV